MAERVAVSRIIVGKGENEEIVTIEPGKRFNTDEYGIDEETLKRYDETGVTREPRDEAQATQIEQTPMEQSLDYEVTEGRSPAAKPSERGVERTIERPENERQTQRRGHRSDEL
jgi:hypothetical protein